MEAEVEPSLETEARLKQEAAEAERRQQELRRLQAAAEAERLAQAQAALEEAGRRERIRQEKEATLPPEPASTDASIVFLVRFPDGTRHTRRFRFSDPLSHVFHFVDAKGAGGLPPGMYRLATQFPRRLLSPAFLGTIAEAGLNSKQEALMLEAMNEDTSQQSQSH